GSAPAPSGVLGIARWSLHQMESNPSSSAIRATASIVGRSASVSWTFGTVTPTRMLPAPGTLEEVPYLADRDGERREVVHAADADVGEGVQGAVHGGVRLEPGLDHGVGVAALAV